MKCNYGNVDVVKQWENGTENNSKNLFCAKNFLIFFPYKLFSQQKRMIKLFFWFFDNK